MTVRIYRWRIRRSVISQRGNAPGSGDRELVRIEPDPLAVVELFEPLHPRVALAERAPGLGQDPVLTMEVAQLGLLEAGMELDLVDGRTTPVASSGGTWKSVWATANEAG